MDSGRDATGVYALHIQRLVAAVACDDVPLTCGEAIIDSLVSRVESNLYSFNVVGTEEIEITTADGQSNADWMLEENMMAPVHLLYPGGEHERIWLEDVIHVTKDGGRPLFSWGFDPLIR